MTWVTSSLMSTVKLASSRPLNVASSVTVPADTGRSTYGEDWPSSTIALPELSENTAVAEADVRSVLVLSLRAPTTCARASCRTPEQSKTRSIDTGITSEPKKAGKGNSVSSNDTKRTSGTEAVALSPYAEMVAVSLTWSHVAPGNTPSPSAPYEAQPTSRASIMTAVRASEVRSLLVPSEKETEMPTAVPVGTEIGATAALSLGSASFGSTIMIVNDSASGI